MPEEVSAQCPYCGEAVELEVDEVGPSNESYVEDCSVCCRPWTVTVHRESDGDEDAPGVWVSLARDDD